MSASSWKGEQVNVERLAAILQGHTVEPKISKEEQSFLQQMTVACSNIQPRYKTPMVGIGEILGKINTPFPGKFDQFYQTVVTKHPALTQISELLYYKTIEGESITKISLSVANTVGAMLKLSEAQSTVTEAIKSKSPLISDAKSKFDTVITALQSKERIMDGKSIEVEDVNKLLLREAVQEYTQPRHDKVQYFLSKIAKGEPYTDMESPQKDVEAQEMAEILYHGIVKGKDIARTRGRRAAYKRSSKEQVYVTYSFATHVTYSSIFPTR